MSKIYILIARDYDGQTIIGTYSHRYLAEEREEEIEADNDPQDFTPRDWIHECAKSIEAGEGFVSPPEFPEYQGCEIMILEFDIIQPTK